MTNLSYLAQRVVSFSVWLTFGMLQASAVELSCRAPWPKEMAASYGIRTMTKDERAAEKALSWLGRQESEETESRCGFSSFGLAWNYQFLAGDEEIKALDKEIAETKRCEKKVTEEFKPKLEKIYANYDSNSNICRYATLKGRIHAVDGKRFAAWQKRNPFVSRLSLHSPGGAVGAAIDIGRIIRSRFISVTTSRHGIDNDKKWDCRRGEGCCASACVLILAAGVRIYPGNIGLHRPTSSDFGLQSHDYVRSTLSDAMNKIAAVAKPRPKHTMHVVHDAGFEPQRHPTERKVALRSRGMIIDYLRGILYARVRAKQGLHSH